MTNRGKFIVLEGGEGVGKSLLSNRLAEFLRSQGLEVWQTYEPGGTEIAVQIRKLFSNPTEKLDAMSELLLVSAARRQHVVHEILPRLRGGSWIICDRYFYSSLVYQGYVGGLSQAFVEDLSFKVIKEAVPDLLFLLDCPIEISRQRVSGRITEPPPQSKQENAVEGVKRFDEAGENTQNTIRQGFLNLAKRFPFIVLDSKESADAVYMQALSHLKPMIAKAPR